MPALLVLGALAAAPVAAAERRFTLNDFDRVVIEGPFDVVLTTGKAPSGTATGSAAAVETVSMEVQGRMLRIRPNRSTWGGYPGEPVQPPRLTITTHLLRTASVIGSARLSIDKAQAMRFDVNVSGSGRIGIDKIEADTLILGLLGSGEIGISGAARSLRATIQGSGDLKGQALTAEDAMISTDTSGVVELSVRRAVTIDATGPGDVLIAGGPACTFRNRGSGRTECGD